jgi:hypothetical protein
MRFSWLVAILLLVSASFAIDTYIQDGHGGVYWDNGNGARISAYPEKSYSYGNEVHYQYVNFSYNNTQSVLVNISFVFQQSIGSGDMFLWANTTKTRYVAQAARGSDLRVVTTTGFTQLASPPSVCNIGDQQNALWYNVNFTNGSINACFDSIQSVNGNTYTLNYSYNKTIYLEQQYIDEDWVSVGNLFYETRFGDYDVWTINNVNFTNPTLYKTKMVYSAGGSGKYSIYAHEGSPQEVVAQTKQVYVELDPIWVSGTNENLPYWVENNTASNYQIYARGNLTSLGQYNITVYYGGTTNRSNIRTTFDYGDDFSTDTTANYVQSGAGCTLSFNATGKRLTQNNVGVCLIEPMNAKSLGTAYNQLLTVNFMPSGWGNYEGGSTGFSTNSTMHGYTAAAAIGRGGYIINKLGDNFYQTITSAITVGIPQHTYGSWNVLGNGSAMINGSFYAENSSLVRNTFIDSRDTSGYYGIYMYSQTAEYDDYAAYAQCGQQTIAYGAEVASPVVQDGETYQKHRSVYINSTVGGNCTFLLDFSQFNSAEMFIVSGLDDVVATPSVNYTTLTPANGTYQTNTNIFVNSSYNMTDSCTLYFNSTTYNMTSNTANQFCYYNVTSLPDATYQFYVYAYNSTNASLNVSTANRTITIDTAAPSNLAFSLSNNTWVYLNGTFNLAFTEANLASCRLQINGTNYTMSNISSGLCQYQLNDTVGNYTYLGFVFDLANFSTATWNFSVNMFNLSNTSANYSTPVQDMSNNTHNLTVNITNYWGTVFALMEYNGTNYTATLSSYKDGVYNFTKSVLAPIVTANTIVPVRWYYFLNNSSAPTTAYNFSYSITVIPTNITDCSVTLGTVLANFTFYDQASPTGNMVASTMDGTFYLHSIATGDTKNFSFNWTTPSNFIAVCINASSGSYSLDSIQQFRATNYRNLFYYMLNQSVNLPAGVNVSLYNLNSSISTATSYTILSQANQPQSNAYLQVQRYYPALNQFITVSMGKADTNGVASTYAIPNDVIYRYVVIQNYQIAYTSGSSTLPCNPASTLCALTILFNNLQPNEYAAFVNNAGVGCAINPGVSVFCTSNNPSGTGTNLRLRLWEVGTYVNTLVCDNTLATGSGTVICPIPDATKTYYYLGTSEIGSIIVIGSGDTGIELGTNANALLGSELGALAGIGLIIAFAAVGTLGGFAAAIIMALIGLIFASLIGFINIGLMALGAIVAVGLALAFIMRS